MAEDVCHVGDNLRQWAERVQASRLAHSPEVTGYDPDWLAQARNYAAIPLPVAIWSLRLSAEVWCTVLNDAYHHLWDVNRILVRPSA